MELLRYQDRRRPPIPRESRLCRFCQEQVETERHALWECRANEAVAEVRESYKERLGTAGELGVAALTCWRAGDWRGFLDGVLATVGMAEVLAAFVYRVMKVFEATDVYRVAE